MQLTQHDIDRVLIDHNLPTQPPLCRFENGDLQRDYTPEADPQAGAKCLRAMAWWLAFLVTVAAVAWLTY